MNRALFSIDGDGFDGPVDAAPFSRHELRLRAPTGARTLHFQIAPALEDGTAWETAHRHLRDDQLPALMTGEVEHGLLYELEPNETVTVSLPSARHAPHGVVVRCLVDGGVSRPEGLGRRDPNRIHERLITIR